MKKLLKVMSILACCIGIGMGGYYYCTHFSVQNIDIKNHLMTSPKIADSLNNLKIAFISDLQFNHFMNQERLDKMIQEINSAKPDVLIFGGDLFDDPSTYPVSDESKKSLIQSLKKLDIPYGKFAVLGEKDHDDAIAESIGDILFQADFECLTNQSIQIRKDGSDFINLVGIDSMIGGKSDIEKALSGINPELFTIVVTHASDIAPSLPVNGIDLVLSGHSHGGQVQLPLIGPVETTQGSTKYEQGITTLNKTTILVTNGLGTTKKDIRFFSSPQCHIIRLSNE